MNSKRKWDLIKSKKDFRIDEESYKIEWSSSSDSDSATEPTPNFKKFKTNETDDHDLGNISTIDLPSLNFNQVSETELIFNLIKSASLECELDQISLSPTLNCSKLRSTSPILNTPRNKSPILNTSRIKSSPILNCSSTISSSPILFSKNKTKRRLLKQGAEDTSVIETPNLFSQDDEIEKTKVVIEESESVSEYEIETTSIERKSPDQTFFDIETNCTSEVSRPDSFLFRIGCLEAVLKSAQNSQISEVTSPTTSQIDDEVIISTQSSTNEPDISWQQSAESTPPEILSPEVKPEDININTEVFVDFSQKNKHGVRKTKKKPPEFGTESYKLAELLRRQKSDIAFWKHEQFLNVKCGILDEHLILRLTVKSFWTEYNKVLIISDFEGSEEVLAIANESLLKSLRPGVILSVYPPYIRRKILIRNSEYDCLLNVNKIIVEKYH